MYFTHVKSKNTSNYCYAKWRVDSETDVQQKCSASPYPTDTEGSNCLSPKPQSISYVQVSTYPSSLTLVFNSFLCVLFGCFNEVYWLFNIVLNPVYHLALQWQEEHMHNWPQNNSSRWKQPTFCPGEKLSMTSAAPQKPLVVTLSDLGTDNGYG